jgi:hypothetical protein
MWFVYVSGLKTMNAKNQEHGIMNDFNYFRCLQTTYTSSELFNPYRYLSMEEGGAGETILQGPFEFGSRICPVSISGKQVFGMKR